MNISIAKERISSVVKPDSITASQGDFLATHVEIKKLHLLNKFNLVPEVDESYAETEVFKKYVLNPNNKHQFIAVYGQSGTGKSHLIRWFEAKFQNEKPENEVVLFIRRSDNTLKGTIRQLLATPEVRDIANKEVYDRLVKATVYEDENKLKGRIYHDFINEIEFDDESKDIHLSGIKRKRLIAFLVNEVVQTHMMSSDGPIERIYSKIAEHTMVDRDTIAQFEPEDFYVSTDLFEDIQQVGADPKALKMARELMADESGQEDAKKVALYLNQFLNDVIQRCAGIEAGDFRLIFQDIRKELFRIGKNLTLFIEDVTSFTGVDDALLDALIVEHTGMNEADQICRISSIVGTTSNYLQNNFRDNHKDRITKFIYIPSDVFEEEGVFEFVGRYLNTMSLSESKVTYWMKNKALASEYPIHELTEGEDWESISINDGKKLNLYPFTKNSIRYLYNNRLGKGHQTPRYIIRDIIEPVVTEIMMAKDKFPSEKFKVVSINVTLSMSINNQIKDSEEANRLIRFLSIWGDGDPTQYEEEGKIYVSSVNKKILSELKLPEVTFVKGQPVNGKKTERQNEIANSDNFSGKNDGANIGNKGNGTTETKAPHVSVPPERIEKANKANAMLTEWSTGATIDISANVGVGGTIKTAQSDITSYIYSAINWQSEGISADNVDKIKKSYKNNFVKLERQLKGEGFYTLMANWESVNVIMAFIRWREFGKESWNYQDSDLDAFIVTGWFSKVKKEIINHVKSQNIGYMTYIEAAMLAEIYRSILVGSYNGKTIKEFDRKNLFVSNCQTLDNTAHSSEWKNLVSVLNQKGADKINQETVNQYFNLPQGDGGSVKVLDDIALTDLLNRLKTEKLVIKEELALSDTVKLRKDTYTFLKNILDQIDKVAKAEVGGARNVINRIYDYFDEEEIEEDDIRDVISKIKEFYDEINKSQINIPMVGTDNVKNNASKIEKAIESIGGVLDKKHTLDILLAFSTDPLAELLPLYNLLEKVKGNVDTLDTKLVSAKNALGISDVSQDAKGKYTKEKLIISNGLAIFEGGQI